MKRLKAQYLHVRRHILLGFTPFFIRLISTVRSNTSFDVHGRGRLHARRSAIL